MAWLHFLYNVGWIVQIAANVTVLYYVFPAYKRTKQKAFLLITFALLIAIFDDVCDQTIGLVRMVGATYYLYHTERRLAYLAVIILDTAGFLLLLRSYMGMIKPSEPTTTETTAPDSPSGPGFLSRLFHKLGE